MTPFHVGMMVVCLKDGKNTSGKYTALTVKGGIYTIREIKTHPSWGDLVGLLFEEITNPIDHCGWEYSFNSIYFRPVTKTDISIFQAMLAPSPKQRVDA